MLQKNHRRNKGEKYENAGYWVKYMGWPKDSLSSLQGNLCVFIPCFSITSNND